MATSIFLLMFIPLGIGMALVAKALPKRHPDE